MTGAETLEFLGRMHGSVDRAYRDELVQTFRPRHAQADPGAVEGQPPEGPADRRTRDACGSAPARRADLGARSADGGRLPRDGDGVQGARPDRVSVLPHPQRGRGALRQDRDPAVRAARRRGHAGRVCDTSARRPSRRPSRATPRSSVRSRAFARSEWGATRCGSRSADRSARWSRPSVPTPSWRSRAGSRRSRRSSCTTTRSPTAARRMAGGDGDRDTDV